MKLEKMIDVFGAVKMTIITLWLSFGRLAEAIGRKRQALSEAGSSWSSLWPY